jgi:YidC/Oxa1 family membrane protein insertase
MFNTYLYQPILHALLFLNSQVGSLGLAIILLTLAIRLVLLPLTLPAMKSQAKIKDLKPELDKLKEKFAADKVGLQQAQVALYKEHKINPAAGCLPYLAQFAVLIALYRVFIDLLKGGNIANTSFLWFNLTEVDHLHILPIVAAATQLVMGLMIAPAADASAEKALATTTKTPKDDKKADDMADMAASMQQQMIFLMPAMTGFLAWSFPSGLGLYWVISTGFSVVQQYVVSGWGGLPSQIQKITSYLRGIKSR